MILLDGIDKNLRRGKAVRYRLDDLAADRDLAAFLDVIVRRDTAVAQKHIEFLAIEGAVRGLEGRIVADELGEAVLRKPEVHVGGKLIERCAGNELRHRLLPDAKGACLLRRDLHAQLLAYRLDLAAIGEAEFVGIDVLIADRDNGSAIATGDEGALDAPHTEGCRKKKQQTLGNPGLGDFSQHFEHRKANLVIIKSSPAGETIEVP